MMIHGISLRVQKFRLAEERLTDRKIGNFSDYTKSAIYVMTLLLAIVAGINTPWVVDRLVWYLMIW